MWQVPSLFLLNFSENAIVIFAEGYDPWSFVRVYVFNCIKQPCRLYFTTFNSIKITLLCPQFHKVVQWILKTIKQKFCNKSVGFLRGVTVLFIPTIIGLHRQNSNITILRERTKQKFRLQFSYIWANILLSLIHKRFYFYFYVIPVAPYLFSFLFLAPVGKHKSMGHFYALT